jgi:hypothetical protein
MTEIWMDIEIDNVDYNYEVSNKGNVKNTQTGRILKPHLRTGYYSISLSNINKKKTYNIHTLVATMFIDNPNNCKVINHIDGNKLNNNVENLEWCTYKENTAHALENKLIKLHRKKVKQLSYDGTQLIKIYDSIRDAEKETGISNKQISKVCRNKMPTAHGFRWEYVDPVETIQINEVDGKEITDFPNYIITRDGKIYSKSAKRYMVINKTTKYGRIKLSNNNVQKDSYIHTLVATLYIPNPDNKPFILHKNFNTDDNSVDNLCWSTLKEIMEHYKINNKTFTNEELASPM